jgi:hypothetical protein
MLCSPGLPPISYASEDRRHHPRAAASVHHCDHPQRSFIRCIGDQILVYRDETQRTRSQIRSSVSLIWERYQCANGVTDFLSDAMCRLRAVIRDIFPNIGDVLSRKGMKVEATPHGHFLFNRSSSRLRRLSKKASPSMGFTLPLFRSS